MSTPRPEAQANSTLQVTQARVMRSEWTKPVSYTHLTLPTICSV